MINILTADIGGTNSRFAHFESDKDDNLVLAHQVWLKTTESSSFGELLQGLKMSEFPLQPENADISVLAIAGPVEKGVKSKPPFISWGIDISNAQRDYGLKRAYLINDFVAQAYACRSSIGRTAQVIKDGTVVESAAAAVIGAGTALGKAVILPDDQGTFLAVPSEGGHASFPFQTEKEFKFENFLFNKLGDSYITWNKVVSGRGLSYVHEFLTGEELTPEDVINRISPESETHKWVSGFYGRACRDFALETLALGGVYVSGGVAARNPGLIRHRAFAEEFCRSDTLSDILSLIPVFLITDQNSGLWGCAFLGLQKLKQ